MQTERSNSPARVRPSRRGGVASLAAVVLLLILPFAVYARNLNDYFMSDDFDLVNSFYGKPPSYVLQLLVDNESGKVWKAMGIDSDLGHGYLRPLKIWSMMLDFTLWGTNPVGFHITCTLLFSLNVLFVYRILDTLLKDGRHLAVLGAAITAIHPVFSGLVPSITFREETMAALFGLWAIHRFLLHRVRGRSIASFYVLYLLALLTKESAIGIPLFALAYDLAHGNLRIHRRDSLLRVCRTYAPLLLVLAIYFALRYAAFGNFVGGDEDVTSEFYLSPRRFVLYSVWFYNVMFSPWLLSLPYRALLRILAPAAVAAALGALAWRRKRLDRSFWRALLFVGPLWYLSWLIPAYGVYFSNRHNIFPVVGWILFGAVLLHGLFRAFPLPRFWRPALLAGVMALSVWAFLPATLAISERYDSASKTVAYVRASIERATEHLPPGSRILVENVPHWWGTPSHFGCGLLSALKLPFTESDLANRSMVYNRENIEFNGYDIEMPETFDFVYVVPGDFREPPNNIALW